MATGGLWGCLTYRELSLEWAICEMLTLSYTCCSTLDWVLLAVGLATLLYWYLTRHHSYWQSVGVPNLPGTLPGVGHMWDAFVFKASNSWLFCKMYKQIENRPAVGVYDFRSPALLLKNLDLIKDVLIKEFSSFHDNAMTMDPSIDEHISKNPFILKGDSWKTIRQQLNPAFSPARVKSMFPLIEAVCKELNGYIEKHTNEDIDVNQLCGLFASEVVAKCAFGVDGNAFTDPNHGEFYQQGRKFWDNSLYSPFIMLMLQYFPIINKVLRRRFVPIEVTKFFIGLIKQAEEYRVKNPDKAPDDYFQFLLSLKSKDTGFTIDDVLAQSLTFFTDGFETSSVAASFLIHELTVNPDVQEALRQEVMSMESFSYDNIVALDLLDRVIKETLRKHSVFAMVRVCTKDHTLHSGRYSFPVRKGHYIVLPVYAIHHDPENYPEPDKFNPDRFLPDEVKYRHPMAFIGFGGGPRMCIGNRFATTMIKVFTANVLKNYRLIKCSKTQEQVKIAPDQILPVAEGGLWCRILKL